MPENDYRAQEVDGEMEVQGSLFEQDPHSGEQVGSSGSAWDSGSLKSANQNGLCEVELDPRRAMTAQMKAGVDYPAGESDNNHSHTSHTSHAAARELTSAETAATEDGACPYQARLRQAQQAYELQSAELPESQRELISSSYDADLLQTLTQAWEAVGRHLGNPNDPSIFQRSGRPVYLQTEVGVHGTRLTIHVHTPATMSVETSRAIYWHDRCKTLRVARGGLTPLSGPDLDAVSAAIEAADARPHARIDYTPPSESLGKASPETWDIVYPSPHYPNSMLTQSMAMMLPQAIELPPLEAIVDKPVLSTDGTHLVIRRGYHRAEGIYMDRDGSGEMPPVEECVKRLDQLFGTYVEDPLARMGFPFDSPASRAHLYASLVAGVIGPAVPKKPVFLFDKATPRTGATFMAESVSIILTGDLPTYVRAGTQARGSVDEMAKGLTAALSEAKGVILMDNATGTLDDPEWNRYATSEVWESRRLGRNDRTVRLSRRNIVDILTANNLQLTTESAGWVCISRLDAGMEHPEERHFSFSPRERARKSRRYYLEAVVGLVAHWLNSGAELERGINGWGGYEEWRDMTGGILKAASIDGFGEPVGLTTEDRLHDGGEKAFVRWWWNTHGQKPLGTREMSEPAVIGDDQTGEPGILTDLKGQGMKARATSLGRFTSSLVGRTYDVDSGKSVVIKPAGSSNNRALYRLEVVR